MRSSTSWNLKVLVFQERGKPEYPEKNLSEQGREPATNSTHIWRRRRDLNPGHIGGRRVPSPLHPLTPQGLYLECRNLNPRQKYMYKKQPKWFLRKNTFFAACLKYTDVFIVHYSIVHMSNKNTLLTGLGRGYRLCKATHHASHWEVSGWL